MFTDLFKYILKRLGFWENPIFYENDTCSNCGKNHETIELLNHELVWTIHKRTPINTKLDFMNYKNFTKLLKSIKEDTYIRKIYFEGNACRIIVQYYPHLMDEDDLLVDRQEAYISNCPTYDGDCRRTLMEACLELFKCEHIPEYVKICIASSISKYF